MDGDISGVKFDSVTNRITEYDNYIMPFGKYRGLFLVDIFKGDNDYFMWLFKKAGGDLKLAMEHVIGKEEAECQENTQKTKKLLRHLRKWNGTIPKKERTGY